MSKKNVFDSVAQNNIPSSVFDLSHDVKSSYNMGFVVPVMCEEVIPGDVFHVSPASMMRFQALVAPVMHKVDITTRFFFIPNRLLWPGFEDWIMNVSPGNDAIPPFFQLDASNSIPVGSLGDHLGYPAGVVLGAETNLSPLPIAAYLKMYDDWFRLQQFEEELFEPLTAGENSDYVALCTGDMLRANWEKDYFTAALPSPQQGDAVMLPITQSATIPVTNSGPNAHAAWKAFDTAGAVANIGALETAGGAANVVVNNGAVNQAVSLDPQGSLVVDVQSDAVSLNTLRRAEAIQKWLETNERSGERYIEGLRAHFNVISSDARLQRAEYIGGFRQNMVISEVLSTAQTVDGSSDILNPVGQMAGHGISVGNGNMISYRAEEFGWILAVKVVSPKTAYQQGIARKFTRFDRYEYPWPLLANLGEQEIFQREIYAATPNPDDVFGYVPRYSDFKFLPNRVAGDFRTNLDYWHWGRIFALDPALTSEFLKCNPRTNQFAVTDDSEDHVLDHTYFSIHVNRKLPYYGIPTL